MAKPNPLRTLQHRTRKTSESASRVWTKMWPINWNLFRRPGTLTQAVYRSSRAAQSIVAISVVGLILGIVLTVSGLYNLLTTEVPTQGGVVREVSVNNQFAVFNPVLELSSPAEQKVTSLLYHPLYNVEYANFSQTGGSEPTITPILLSQAPEWLDAEAEEPTERYKTLRLELKPDLQWSNGEPLTVADVQYSFDRLKEARGNDRFRDLFESVTLEPREGLTFDLVSEISNPGLQFAAGFSPISRDYFQSQNTDRLVNTAESVKPTVTSGYFTFAEGDIDDPDTAAADSVANPVRDERSNNIAKVILSRNPVTNYRAAQMDFYVFENLPRIFSDPQLDAEANAYSLEERAQAGQVDLYTRNLGTNLESASQELAERLPLERQLVATNTYYTLFLDIRQGDYFVNPGLRQYALCKLRDFDAGAEYSEALQPVPEGQRVVPVQLGLERDLECPEDLDTLLLENEIAPGAYTLETDEAGDKQILVFGQLPPELELVGLEESNPILSELASFFDREIGLTMTVVSGEEAVDAALREKTYHAAFLPVTYVSRDLTAIYGETGRDLSEIRRNRLVDPTTFEANLQAYGNSNYTDETAQAALADFFAREFVSYNLYQTQGEYYYSDRIIGLEDNLPSIQVFPEDVYAGLSAWFASTSRELDD